ncbi:MAG: hypothetical protein OEM39_03120 [Acidimicrobiia bacterium]|nr:hypothetical protein [Acidimicrobiia bacterium]
MSNTKKPHVKHRGLRIRRSTVAILLAVSGTVTACTPAEIEQSIQMLTVSFEEGGLESGLSTAAFIGQVAVPVIGMRLGSFGP